jgi:hypothetical protein
MEDLGKFIGFELVVGTPEMTGNVMSSTLSTRMT